MLRDGTADRLGYCLLFGGVAAAAVAVESGFTGPSFPPRVEHPGALFPPLARAVTSVVAANAVDGVVLTRRSLTWRRRARSSFNWPAGGWLASTFPPKLQRDHLFNSPKVCR